MRLIAKYWTTMMHLYRSQLATRFLFPIMLGRTGACHRKIEKSRMRRSIVHPYGSPYPGGTDFGR